MPREHIAGIRSDEIGRPVGAYRVELLDPRTGRVLDRVEKANYITEVQARYAAWGNGYSFLDNAYSYLPLGNLGSTGKQYAGTPRNVTNPPAQPTEFIAGLTSDVAEAAPSSWATGRVIGWASRWKSANVPAAGTRGQINEAQSEFTKLGIKQVYEFNEDQANGTIGSLAICRILPTGAARLIAGTGGAYYADTGNLDGTGLVHVMNWDPANNVAYALRRDGSATYAQEWDISSVTVDEFGVADVSGVTMTSEVLLASTFYSTSNSPGYWQTGSAGKLLKIGTDWLLASTTTQGRGWVARYNAAGARSWIYDAGYPGTGSSYGGSPAGIAVIGTTGYFTHAPAYYPSSTTHDTIKRLDLTTGAETATIPFPNALDGGTVLSKGGCVTDGTDLYVMTDEGIIKMTTAGAVLDYLGDPLAAGDYTDTGVSPWSTTGSGYRATNLTGARFWTTNNQQLGTLTVGTLDLSGGKLYLRNSANVLSIEGRNAWSRTVFDTAIVKGSSSTMKWTYELTLPESWLATPPHSALPI